MVMTKKQLEEAYKQQLYCLGYTDPMHYDHWYKWFTKFGRPMITPVLKRKIRYILLKYFGVLLVLKNDKYTGDWLDFNE